VVRQHARRAHLANPANQPARFPPTATTAEPTNKALTSNDDARRKI
jgi:hypothetical protein